MKVVGDIFKDSNFTKVPYKCILRQTGAGVVPPTIAAGLDADCNPYLNDFSARMACCGRIMNEILDTVYMKGGWMGFQNASCISEVLPVKFTLSGLNLETAQNLVSQDVLGQLSADEIAHLVPALIKPEFIRNIYLTTRGLERQAVSVDVDLNFDVRVTFTQMALTQ